QVMPVECHQLLTGEKAQPQEKGHRRVAQILRQARPGLQVGLLKDVGGVDASLQPLVEAQGQHPPQPLVVPRQQLSPLLRVPLARPLEEVVRLAGVIRHGWPPTIVTALAADQETKKRWW